MQKNLQKIFIAAFMFSCTPVFGLVEQESLINNVLEINLNAFPWDEKEWEEKDYEVFLKNSVERRINPEPRKKRSNAFEFVKAAQAHNPRHDNSVFIGPIAWKDLNLLCGDSNKHLYVGSAIDRTIFELGTISTLLTLAAPTDEIGVLRSRQLLTKLFIEQDDLTNELRQMFASCTAAENVMLSFWRTDNFKHAAKRFYFSMPGLRWLNNYPSVLLLRSSFDHQRQLGWALSGALAAATLFCYSAFTARGHKVPKKLGEWAEYYQSSPARILLSLTENRWLNPLKKFLDRIAKNRIVASSSAAGLGAVCALGVPGSARWAYQCFIIEDCLQKLMMQVATFVGTMYKTYQIIRENDMIAQHVEFRDLVSFFEKTVPQSKKLQKLLQLLQYNTFKGKSSVFSHKGNVLRAFSLMHELKQKFEPALLAIGNIDKWTAIAHLFKQFEDTSTPFCFAQYQTANQPYLNLQDFWHPLINAQNVVPNSIILGTQEERRNIIVTGPNAGGKSTALKAIAVSCVMAQTFGIAPARSMLFTPFSLIATYLNITDDLGAGNSLFKAEVIRTDKLLNTIESLMPEQHSFVIFDEIFNGTTPLEGKASAYGVAKYLSTLPNTICLVATHFRLLTELEKTTDSFANYMVSVLYDRDGNIVYPYKLKRGVSDQHVAIDILRSEGFASLILDEAEVIIQARPCY